MGLPPGARRAVRKSLQRRRRAEQGAKQMTSCASENPQLSAPVPGPKLLSEAQGSLCTADFQGLLGSTITGGEGSYLVCEDGPLGRGANGNVVETTAKGGSEGCSALVGTRFRAGGGVVPGGLAATSSRFPSDVDTQLEAFKMALACGDDALKENSSDSL